MRSRVQIIVLILLSIFTFMPARATDVKRFEVLKGVHYYQLSRGGPQLQTNNAFRFTTQVYADVLGDVLGGSVYTPKIPRIDLLPDNDGDPYRFRDKFDDRFTLENNFPNGAYQLGIRGAHDGDHTMSFSLTGDQYPPAPMVNNYAGLQILPYNQYNVISWQPFTGGGGNDFIQMQIEDLQGNNVWETPDFGESGALDGLATQTILPADTLNPGAIYIATIRFVKVLYNSSAAYPGAFGGVGYFTRTEFTVRPVATGLSPVVDRLQIWRRHLYEYTSSGLLTEQVVPWQFESKLDAVTSNQVSAVRLYLPTGSTNDLVPDITGEQFTTASPPLTNGTVFASIYSDGAYTFDITNSDSTVQRAVINLPPGAFPAAPKLLNLSSLTNRPAGQPMTVRWEPWLGAGQQDFIRVELSNEDGKVWDTSNYSSPKHLPATATEVIIAGTNFVAGHDYTLQVHFNHVNISDTQVVPGAMVFGGFDTRTKFDFGTQLPDVVSFRVAEGQYFWQRGTNIVERDAVAPYRFEARANAATRTSLRSAQVVTPKGERLQLDPFATNTLFRLVVTNGVAAALADGYPAGLYTMLFETQYDGSRTSSVALPPIEFPPQPFIQNYSNVWKITTTDDFPIRWAPWQNANTNTDTIVFSVETLSGTVLFSSANATTKHPLLATSTNVFIFGKDGDTPGELSQNQSYIARLRFERRNKTEEPTYPGARGTGAVFSELAFYISTFDPAKTYKSSATFDRTNQVVQIKIGTFAQIGRTYAVYESFDLKTWNFIKTQALTPTNATMLTIPPVSPTASAYYKTSLLP